MDHKINTERKLRYVAKDFTTGLSDLTLKARNPSGDLFEFSPSVTELILSEISNGEYEGAYTPDALGVWQELVTSTVNGDKAVRSYLVVAIDLATLKTGLDTIEGKVDTVDTVVDSIATAVATKASQTSVDAIQVDVDAVKVDTESIISKVDALDVSPGGYFSN